MERFENLLDFINELNENGRIQYDDYSRLFDLVQEFAGAEEAINAAATDIAALLWLNGNCEYCEHGEKEEFSGANILELNPNTLGCGDEVRVMLSLYSRNEKIGEYELVMGQKR